jgi:HEAT repeat protein
MAGLLRSGEIEGTLAASEKLIALLNSPNPAERSFAAQVLGEAGLRSFYRPLLRLLADEDWQVRRSALAAAGKLKNPKVWPAVVESLAFPKTRSAAVAALVAGGRPVLPELKADFARAVQDREVLTRLARVCGRIGGDKAIALLKEGFDYPDEEVRTHLLGGLSQCGYQAAGPDERVAILQRIQAELADAAWVLAAMADIGDDAMVALVREALRALLARSRARLFFLLSFVYDAQAILRARDNLSHPAAEKRAYALEVIDVLIPQEMKGMLLPLLQEASPVQQLQALSGTFAQLQLSRIQRLEEMLDGAGGRLNTWTRACVLHTLGRLDAVDLEVVAAALSAPEPLVRETAAWTLSKLSGSGYSSELDALRHDPSPQVARAVRRLEAARTGEEGMLSTIERVLVLKTVGIFAGTPDEILAEVATLLEEVDLKAGQTIFEIGELGDCMYIIVDGKVRVHSGERTLNYLGQGEVFGEMALLDPEPRMASVTAVEDTQLLRLDQEPFYELMDDRIEVVRGIIRVLTGHLRARVKDLNEARARLENVETAAPIL